MFETLMVLLTFATVALGLLVWYLFEQKNEIRAGFDSRLKAIESLEGPFARKLADEGPAPLRRELSLGIHLDARFWGETLQLTPTELDEIKTSILWHDVFSEKGAALEDFGKWFYGDIRVRIQEWRGGYAHVKVEYPYCPRKEPKSIELYHGRSGADLWQFQFQARPGEIFGGSLWLKWDGHHVRLYAAGGRFGWGSFMDPDPAPQNVFLTVPMGEGPRAEPYFKPEAGLRSTRRHIVGSLHGSDAMNTWTCKKALPGASGLRTSICSRVHKEMDQTRGHVCLPNGANSLRGAMQARSGMNASPRPSRT
jgi:hypothetical protein